MGVNGAWFPGNTDYVGRPIGSVIRVFFLARRNLPVHFGIDARIALYGRNGETGPIDAGNWHLIVYK